MGTIGFAINVVSTLFLFGDLMTRRTLERVMTAVTFSVGVVVLVALSLQFSGFGSVVDPLAELWFRHETWKLALATAFLVAAGAALVATAFAGRSRTQRLAGRVGLAMYAISAAMLVVAALVAHNPPPPAYAATIRWLRLHPTLAIHETYATASLWGVVGAVCLPLYAGRSVADALARLLTWRVAVRSVNVVLVLAGWILQVAGR